MITAVDVLAADNKNLVLYYKSPDGYVKAYYDKRSIKHVGGPKTLEVLTHAVYPQYGTTWGHTYLCDCQGKEIKMLDTNGKLSPNSVWRPINSGATSPEEKALFRAMCDGKK